MNPSTKETSLFILDIDEGQDVKEVKEIKHHKDSGKPPPIVISNVSYGEGYNVLNH